MAKSTQAEFKAFETMINAVRRAKAEKRREATGTLTPAAMRKHLSSGAPLPLLYGMKPDGTLFTSDDLKKFDQIAARRRKMFGAGKKGVQIDQLVAASRRDDIERSRTQIRNATFYRLFSSKNGVLLHFRTSASPGSRYTSHQVKVRLDEWEDWLTSTVNFKQAAKNILSGRISFDCDCGRHQYWYRYVATIGGFAISPLEHSYPKIRNPNLTGACCKHVLKVLAAMRGPAVQMLIIKEMEKEAEKIGFGGETGAGGAGRWMTQKELLKAKRSSSAMQSLSRKDAAKQFKEYLAAKKGFKKKVKEPKTVDVLKKLRASEKREEALKKKLAAERKARAAEVSRKEKLVADFKKMAKASNMPQAMQDEFIKKIMEEG